MNDRIKKKILKKKICEWLHIRSFKLGDEKFFRFMLSHLSDGALERIIKIF